MVVYAKNFNAAASMEEECTEPGLTFSTNSAEILGTNEAFQAINHAGQFCANWWPSDDVKTEGETKSND